MNQEYLSTEAAWEIIEERNAEIETLGNKVAEQAAVIEKLREALLDMNSGWKYIRESHGDLYGVGWDRSQTKADEALAIPTDSKQILIDWMREQIGEPVAQINVTDRKLEYTMHTTFDTPTTINLPPIPLYKLPECLK